MRYIALLRGINVGGRNKISMPELKAAFQACGFYDVITYINSGNIIFSSESEHNTVKHRCEKIIADRFAFSIPVAVIDSSEFINALEHAPSWWNTDKDSKHNAIFVISPVTAKEVFEEIGDIKPEYERVDYYGSVIFWSAPVKTFSRTRWSKIVGTSVYDSVTIRNANTANKLAELVRG